MNTIKLENIPPKSNPFEHDLFNMGQQIGSNCTIMFPSHPHEVCPFIIVVDTSTGERLEVNLTDDKF